MISANRDRNKETQLMHKELAALLGVSSNPPGPEWQLANMQYDPETFDPRHDKPRLDPPAEMDKYDKLPLDVKVERLQAALALSKQSKLDPNHHHVAALICR
jgi:FKBP12-rapamycin complex-associated protein